MTLGPGRFSGQVLASTGTAGQRGMPGRTVSGIGGVGFTPAHLPGLALWLDAADTSTITASGGKVSQWDDKSGLGRHVVQANGANQPTTGATTKNGLNVLDFAGSQFLRTSGNHAVVSGAKGIYSAYAVVFLSSVTGGQTVVSQDNDAGTRLPQLISTNGAVFRTIAFYATSGNSQDSTATISVSTWYTVAGIATPGTTETFANNSSNGSGASTAAYRTGSNPIGVGGSAGGTTFALSGSIAEIALFSEAHTADIRSLVTNYLNAKWAVY